MVMTNENQTHASTAGFGRIRAGLQRVYTVDNLRVACGQLRLCLSPAPLAATGQTQPSPRPHDCAGGCTTRARGVLGLLHLDTLPTIRRAEAGGSLYDDDLQQ